MKLGLFLSILPHILKFAFYLFAFNLHPNIFLLTLRERGMGREKLKH